MSHYTISSFAEPSRAGPHHHPPRYSLVRRMPTPILHPFHIITPITTNAILETLQTSFRITDSSVLLKSASRARDNHTPPLRLAPSLSSFSPLENTLSYRRAIPLASPTTCCYQPACTCHTSPFKKKKKKTFLLQTSSSCVRNVPVSTHFPSFYASPLLFSSKAFPFYLQARACRKSLVDNSSYHRHHHIFSLVTCAPFIVHYFCNKIRVGSHDKNTLHLRFWMICVPRVKEAS